MKKRVVAVLLSLSMCMATAAEATVASAADFSAEITAAEDNDESVADETADSQDVEDSTVTIEDGEVSDEEQNDAETTPEADVADAADSEDEVVVDFSSEEDFTSDAVSADQVVDDSTADAVSYTGENVVSSTEAVLSYHRWEPITVGGQLRWKLEKISGTKTASAEEAGDAVQTDDAADADVSTDEAVEADVAGEAEETSETDGETAEVSGTVEEAADAAEEVSEITEDTDTDAVSTTKSYYTATDGLVKITTLDGDGNTVFTAKYAFDEKGYLITGTSLVGTNGNDRYYFATADEVEITKPDVNSAYSEVVAPYNSALGQMQTNKWVWDGKKFTYFNKTGVLESKKEGIYKIGSDYYYLKSTGVPFVGEKSTTYNGKSGLYWFKSASGSKDIPGKMARNTWIGINNNRWRYFGSDGRYVKKGVGAYKVLNNSSKLYLLDANGYLIKGKQVKGADGYYYMSNSSGIAYANRLVKVGNYRYYFTSNGRRATWRKRWVQLAGTGSTKYGRYYYFGSVAGRVEEKKGMQKVVVNNKFIGWFLFTNGGNNYQKAWSGSRYFLEDGRMASGVTKVNGKYYFFQRSSTTQYRGQMYKGTWIKYNNKYYYAASNGVLPVSGWRRIRCDGKMYYFCFSNCAALTNRSATRAGTKGWLDSRGRFTTGWVTIDSSRNLARYINPATGKWYRNTSAWIDGVNYRFNKYGNRVYDRTSEFKRSRYYLECDRTNGVMTVYTDSNKKYPIKTIRVSVGNPTSLTIAGTFTLTRSLRWQPLMGPSWGQYGTHVVNGIFVHSVASGMMNGNNLPASEYLKLGSPASHGCIRACVADAKWVYENCNGSKLRVFDGKYSADECYKGPLGRRPLTPLRGSKTFDPTDPNYANR